MKGGQHAHTTSSGSSDMCRLDLSYFCFVSVFWCSCMAMYINLACV